MANSFVHYRSYFRGWRPLCGEPFVPEAVRGTLSFRQVTCPKCLELMRTEMPGDAAARARGGKPGPMSPTRERGGA